MISATGEWHARGFPYALDNGAWTTFNPAGKQPAWDPCAFAQLVYQFGSAADFVVVPDVVGDRERTLELAHEWLPRLDWLPRLLWAAQDGMTPSDVPPGLGVFVGGTDAWKESSLPMWGAWRAAGGPYLHVGRVNSARRIRLCLDAGADSCDGTSATMHAVNTPRLDAASNRRQRSFADLMLEACPPWSRA